MTKPTALVIVTRRVMPGLVVSRRLPASPGYWSPEWSMERSAP
jgi:hypothetical protein